MEIPFWKMHGAANDFILVDDRQQTFPAHDAAWLAEIGARHTGVGCEGIILIQPSETSDFRMRFYNPDGGEVEMCGNGARCVARLARDLEVAPENMSFETIAGTIRAECRGENILLHMTEPTDWRIGESLELEGTSHGYHFVNSGVPHAVVPVADVSETRIVELGAGFRYHDAFSPAGTNVNFVQVTAPHSLKVRTYERGVEAETPACGTGIVASALIMGRLEQVSSPVVVTPTSGDEITIDFDLTSDGATNVTMLGPAAYGYRGTLEYSRG